MPHDVILLPMLSLFSGRGGDKGIRESATSLHHPRGPAVQHARLQGRLPGGALTLAGLNLATYIGRIESRHLHWQD